MTPTDSPWPQEAWLLHQGEVSETTDDLQALPPHSRSGTIAWLNMNWREPSSVDWVLQQSGLPESSCNAVLSENTRPRSFTDECGNLVLILRVVNAQANTEEERLISLRMVISNSRFISLCAFHPLSLSRFGEHLKAGDFDQDVAGLVTLLLEFIQDEINEAVTALTAELEGIEAACGAGEVVVERISSARRAAGQLQRYLLPQRAVLSQIQQQRQWFGAPELQAVWRELGNSLQLSLEEVEMALSRLMILQDELRATLNEKNNRTLYLLSLVTFFFLPLSFLTGFLGMNIPFPWQDSAASFWAVLSLVLMLLATQWALIRRLGWL
ncbi:CorA family divalent cation transporter [Marinobacterium jannaschii]|uniref:CorA family divalent cation transporter n=1 Tax=Marinobacterium jannaschii TaxID=64970 RepID=UPI000484FFC6|nr:CorA family divalent cation transporter [Marinobacterium jannaschii]